MTDTCVVARKIMAALKDLILRYGSVVSTYGSFVSAQHQISVSHTCVLKRCQQDYLTPNPGYIILLMLA